MVKSIKNNIAATESTDDLKQDKKASMTKLVFGLL